MIPRETHFLVPPDGMETNPFGNSWPSSDLIKGLRRINNGLCIPDPSTWEAWWYGKEFDMTSVWVGEPLKGRKVVSFHLGMVPEWTQATPEGILRRGWRSVLEKCIKQRVITRLQAEHEFKVSFDYSEESKKFCRTHLMDGERILTEGNASGLCDEHEIAQKHVEESREHRKESAWLQSQSNRMVRNPGRVILDLGSSHSRTGTASSMERSPSR
jgi:hypothetical protein